MNNITIEIELSEIQAYHLLEALERVIDSYKNDLIMSGTIQEVIDTIYSECE